MKIIAFGHRKFVGKDTAARYLHQQLVTKYQHNKKIVKVGFADKVKDISYQLFSWAGLQESYIYDEYPENKEMLLHKIGKTPRQLWIGVGNGIRTCYDNVWLDYVFNNYFADIMIISDLRFPAEANGILKRDGLLYRIDCPWTPVVTDGADEPLANYDKWTGILKNYRKDNVQYLYSQIDKIIEEHF